MTNVKKKQKLRNNEYYNLQETFDELYAKSNGNCVFTKIISKFNLDTAQIEKLNKFRKKLQLELV